MSGDEYGLDLVSSAYHAALDNWKVEASPTERFAEYRGRPNDFVREVLGEDVWDGQECMNNELMRTRRVTCRSSRSTGKTRDIGYLVLYFMNCYECIVITVGASWENVRDQMWAEVRALHASSRVPLLGEPDVVQYRLGPKHYAKGFAAKKEERSQGYHAGRKPPKDDINRDLTEDEMQELAELADTDGMIVWIIDEAPGVDQRVISPIIGSLAPNAYLMFTGNPSLDVEADHTFARSHQEGSGYSRIKLAALPSSDPITADHEFTHVPNWLLHPDTIEEWRNEWKEDSPMWKSHCLAQFHGEAQEAQVVPLELLQSAEQRIPDVDEGPWMGCDIALTKDFCVAALWFDGQKVAEKVWRPKVGDPLGLMSVADTIELLAIEWGRALSSLGWDGSPVPGPRINVDKIGLGEGVYSRLWQKGVHCNPIDNGSKPKYEWTDLTGQLRFRDRRSELHWVYRRALQEGVARLPKRWKDSWKQAQWPRYDAKRIGQETIIEIERKEDIKKRHGASTDYLDADLYAWARPGRARPQVSVID